MNIYVNGDSFASGAELADISLPGFLGYRQLTKNLELSKKEIEWGENRARVGAIHYGSYENYISAGKALSWSAELTKINPSIIVQNGSREGASMVGITHRTVADLLLAKEKNILFDYVFIQLTSCSRFEIYNVDRPDTHFITDRHLSWISSLSKTEKDLATNYVAQYKDADFAIKFLYNLCTLKNSIKGLIGIDPIIVSPAYRFTEEVLLALKENTNPVILNLIRESGMLDIPIECYMSTVQKQNNHNFLPCLHYEQKTHRAYAEIIYNKYLNEIDV
jgi:hypothetical protein